MGRRAHAAPATKQCCSTASLCPSLRRWEMLGWGLPQSADLMPSKVWGMHYGGGRGPEAGGISTAPEPGIWRCQVLLPGDFASDSHPPMHPKPGQGALPMAGMLGGGCLWGHPQRLPPPARAPLARSLSSSNIEGRRAARSRPAPATPQPPAVTLAARGRSSRLARGAG